MQYKKIYLEITNKCNLSCDFCIKNDRKIQTMTFEKFDYILEKLKLYTKYLYFHVLGEPLLHPKINEFINLAVEKGFNVNITTNGYLIDNIKNNTNIRQINISLHSFNEKYKIDLSKYMENIFTVVDKLVLNGTYVSFRFWINSENNSEILKLINKRYEKNIKLQDIKDNTAIEIKEKIYINQFHEFIWPDLKNDYYNEFGKCYALRDHIAILVDGTIVPCCLDSKGIIKFGNVFEDDIEDIHKSERYQSMFENFKNNVKTEELCKKCGFLQHNNYKLNIKI